MNGYIKYTPVRIAVPFVSGILSGLQVSSGMPHIWLLSWILTVSICLLFYFLFLRTSYGMRWVPGGLTFVALYLLGLYSVTITERKHILNKNEGRPVHSALIMCMLESDPSRGAAGYSVNASTIAYADSLAEWIPLRTNILVYFKNDTICKSLQYGDQLVISGDLLPVPGPSNPYAFDYRNYLHNRSVFHQVYLDSGQWRNIGRAKVNPLYLFAYRSRKAFMKTFNDFGIDGQDFALVSALLLGNCEYLDAEIRQEFSFAGATHVLSVSGLHVGIVYVAMDKALFFLKKGKRGRKLHALLTIAFIWVYALITGLSTPVVRAALMFSLVAAGNQLRRSHDSFNILAVAVFLQLLVNPFEITQVGFQLSYLAVLGIFAFYKPFNELVNSRNRLVNWIWPVIAVSLAAQLATTPLSCYYFNMFPVYFLVTNLIVVPLAGLIIYLALPLLLAGSLGFIIHWLAFPLKWSLELMRGSIEVIQSWPGAIIRPIVLSSMEVLFIYLIIIALYGLFAMRERRWMFVGLASCICIAVISGNNRLMNLKENKLVVYDIPGLTAIDLIDHRRCCCLGDSLLFSQSSKLKNKIFPNRLQSHINEAETICIQRDQCFEQPGAWVDDRVIFFKGKRIAIIDKSTDYQVHSDRLKVDVGIISGNFELNPDRVFGEFIPGEVVLDSSVPGQKADKLEQYFNKQGITYHNVRRSGAYILKW
jgi:competence protein ComEC